MINIDSLNSIPQIKHAIIALSKQSGNKLKYEHITNPYGEVFVQIKENTQYSLNGNNINIELPTVDSEALINPITIFVNFDDKPSICVISNNNCPVLAENSIELNPSMLYKITLAYSRSKWYMSMDEFPNRGITSITPSGVVFP